MRSNANLDVAAWWQICEVSWTFKGRFSHSMRGSIEDWILLNVLHILKWLFQYTLCCVFLTSVVILLFTDLLISFTGLNKRILNWSVVFYSAIGCLMLTNGAAKYIYQHNIHPKLWAQFKNNVSLPCKSRIKIYPLERTFFYKINKTCDSIHRYTPTKLEKN